MSSTLGDDNVATFDDGKGATLGDGIFFYSTLGKGTAAGMALCGVT
jgi:hypothetical protein